MANILSEAGKQVSISKTRVLLDNLTPLKNKWAPARANGAAGASDWTEPTCRIVM